MSKPKLDSFSIFIGIQLSFMTSTLIGITDHQSLSKQLRIQNAGLN